MCSIQILYFFGENFLGRAKCYSMPWDQHTVAGYVAEMSYSIISGTVYLLCVALYILFFISLCGYHRALYEMYDDWLSRWCYSDQNANLQQHLSQTIRFHVLIKEYEIIQRYWQFSRSQKYSNRNPKQNSSFFAKCSEAFSPLILIQLTESAIMLSVSIFRLDMVRLVGH